MPRTHTVWAVALAGALAATATPIAHAADDATMYDAAAKAADYWSEKTAVFPRPVFTTNHITDGDTIAWAVPFTTDPGFINIMATGNKDFGAAIDNGTVAALSEFTSPDSKSVDTPTPATAPNGEIVAVLPHGDATAADGTITFDSVDVKGTVTVGKGDSARTGSVVSPALDTIGVLYGVDGGYSTGDDPRNAALPEIAAGLSKMSYRSKKVNNNNPQPRDGAFGTLGVGTTNNVDITRYVSNNSSEDITQTVTAYLTTTDHDLDMKDGVEDGLTPVDGGEVSTVIPAGESRTVTAPMAMTVTKTDHAGSESPTNPIVFLRNLLRDSKGNDVANPTVNVMDVGDVTIDAQASTEQANSKLRADATKQMIYNQVNLGKLLPGKPYNVVAQLFQCAPGNCIEVAAVNREIIPQTETSTQPFSVEVDPSSLADNETFEWELRVYEGTGDFENMGPELISVADHPDTQVVSFSGTQGTNMAGERKENHAATSDSGVDITVTDDAAEVIGPREDMHMDNDERVTGSPDREDEVQDKKLTIGDEVPPAPMEVVRANNAALTGEDGAHAQTVAQERQDFRNAQANRTRATWGGVAALVVIAAIVAVFARRKEV